MAKTGLEPFEIVAERGAATLKIRVFPVVQKANAVLYRDGRQIAAAPHFPGARAVPPSSLADKATWRAVAERALERAHIFN